VDVAAGDEAQGRGSDADDGDGRAVEGDGAPEDGGIPAEPAGPEAFTDHGHRGRPGLLLILAEAPARHRPHSQDGHQGRADAVADELLRLADAGEGEAREAGGGEALEGVGLLTPGDEVQDGGAEGRELELVVPLRDLDEAA